MRSPISVSISEIEACNPSATAAFGAASIHSTMSSGGGTGLSTQPKTRCFRDRVANCEGSNRSSTVLFGNRRIVGHALSDNPRLGGGPHLQTFGNLSEPAETPAHPRGRDEHSSRLV
jgi:hypothetical protein